MFYKIFKYIFYLFFLPLWYLQLLIPRKRKLWVFGAWYGQKYSDNSRALYEYMLDYHSEYKVIWITRNHAIYNKLLNENKPILMTNSLKGIITCLRASVAIIGSDTNDLNRFCLNGIRQIWLWHGMPLKKILFDCMIINIKSKLVKILMPYYYFLPNNTITSSDFFIPYLESAFNLKDNNILKTGLPRCDILFSQETEPVIKEIRKTFKGCKIIFYMPTFRTAIYDGKLFNPFSSFDFDESIFFQKLEDNNFVFLYKPHFIDESVSVKFDHNRFIYIKDNDFDNLYLFLKDIDILMTDYSSVYFDFLVTKKPVILAPFDYEEYLRTAREHYFDYFENIEGNIIRSWKEIYNLLDTGDFKIISDNTIKKYCQYNNGNSCKKLFEIIK